MGKWQELRRIPAPKIEKEKIEKMIEHATAEGHDIQREKLEQELNKEAEHWANIDYHVVLFRDVFPADHSIELVHLSIKRHDRKPIRDWRVLQRIKNQLLGEECEAVELYPAESRCVDTANQYHLWGFSDPKYAMPFGFSYGMKSELTEGTGTEQRKFGDGDKR